jgi:RNA recognition motif-containing protein
MTKKLFVGNLSFGSTEDGLRALFAQHGEVSSVKIITDRNTGRPRGFAFVEMENAENAIAALHDRDFEGRNLVVNEARPPQNKGRGFGQGDRDMGGFRGRKNRW